MTYEEIVEKVKVYYRNANAAKIEGHLAVQFNIAGEGHGAFYLEVIDGRVNIEPYEYYDRNAAINVSAVTLFNILEKRTTLEEELNKYHMTIEGDLGAVFVLREIKVVGPSEDTADQAAEQPEKEEKAV